MELKINYDELTTYLKSRYKVELGVKYVSQDTVTISASKKILLVEMTFSSEIKIERVKASALLLSYESGKISDFLIGKAINYLRQKCTDLSEAIKTDKSGKILLNLAMIKSLQSFTDNVALNDILFTPEGIIVKASLK